MNHMDYMKDGGEYGRGWKTNETAFSLITGASSGIGDAFARVFAKNGHNLFLTARNKKRLESLAEELRKEHRVKVFILPIDLSRKDGPAWLVSQLNHKGVEVENLVNNAGLGEFGIFAESNVERIREMVMVNIHALTMLVRLIVPGMRRRGKGRILNVGSVAGFLPGPCMAVYFATKSYVLSFSSALTKELKSTGITVTALCPGTTDTEFFRRAGIESSPPGRMRMMSAEAVAEAGYRGMMKGKSMVIPGTGNRLISILPRLLPRGVLAELIWRVQRGCGRHKTRVLGKGKT